MLYLTRRCKETGETVNDPPGVTAPGVKRVFLLTYASALVCLLQDVQGGMSLGHGVVHLGQSLLLLVLVIAGAHCRHRLIIRILFFV